MPIKKAFIHFVKFTVLLIKRKNKIKTGSYLQLLTTIYSYFHPILRQIPFRLSIIFLQPDIHTYITYMCVIKN